VIFVIKVISRIFFAVGVKKARSIARTYQLPWIGVHHMEAHALVTRLYWLSVLELCFMFMQCFHLYYETWLHTDKKKKSLISNVPVSFQIDRQGNRLPFLSPPCIR
jgi:hypothetical protein